MRFREILENKQSTNLDEPEPPYERISYRESKFYSHYEPFECLYGGVLGKLEIAYESWGALNSRRDNGILIFTGLSGSSHAKSHQVTDVWCQIYFGNYLLENVCGA